VPAVAFQVQLAFERLVDRFDGLAQRFEQRRCGRIGFAFAGWAQQNGTGLRELVWNSAPK
jgi:hypothetical protein